MSILSLFVLIPVLMLLGLWVARNLNQVRGVMVVGSTALLALSIWLTIAFIQARESDPTSAMLFTYSTPWFKPLNIAYSVGVDGISVVMLLLSSIIVFTGTFASWQLKPMTKEYFLWFTLLSTGVYGYPLDEAARIALLTCTQWLNSNPEYGMEITLVCFNNAVLKSYESIIEAAKRGELEE